MSVKQQQCLLCCLGYYNGAINGVLNSQLKSAIKKFQEDYHIGTDGIWGPQTEAKVREVIGNPKMEKKQENTTVVNKPIVNKPATGDAFWDGIKFFRPEEFQCKCGCKTNDVDHELVEILEKVREHFGRPVTITSGVRCATHNARVGGVSNSQHVYKKAADFVVSEIAPRTVANYLETLLPNTGGIGVYSGWVHVDVRKTKARWNG